jgi:NADH-quinone oxidoreductase subunit L
MAIPSALIGWFAASSFVSNEILAGSVTNSSWFISNIQEKIDPLKMVLEGFVHLPVYLAIAGILIAWLFHKNPKWSDNVVKAINPVYKILLNNYYMDDLYIKIFTPLGRGLGKLLWTLGDMFLIDGLIVNGSAKVINWYAKILRKVQSGYVNTYATFMILGIIVLLTFCTRLIFA